MEKMISIEMRRKMKEAILPEALRFAHIVSPFVSEYDIDRLDKVIIREDVMLNEVEALFLLKYDPQNRQCIAECSFFALSADNTNCQYLTDDGVYVSVSNSDALAKMESSLLKKYKEEYEISFNESEETEDNILKRTKWTISGSNIAVEEIYETFAGLYYEITDAATTLYEAYEEYAKNAGLIDYYLERTGFDSAESEVFEIELTAPVRISNLSMTEYHMNVEDSLCSIRKTCSPICYDITSTVITTEIIKADKPSLFITTETFLAEDDEKIEPKDFEYAQFFEIGKSNGDARSIYHGSDVIARLYFVSPGVYVLKPLDIYFEDELTEYLIVVVELDGSYTLFTDNKSVAAVMEIKENEYHLLIKRGFEELAPFIASVEELVFEPFENHDIFEYFEDEKSFISLNVQFNEARKTMVNWFGSDEDLSLLHAPAIDLASFLKREYPDVIDQYNARNNAEIMEEIYFVQDIKNRCYGVESAKSSGSYNAGRECEGTQMELSDFI